MLGASVRAETGASLRDLCRFSFHAAPRTGAELVHPFGGLVIFEADGSYLRVVIAREDDCGGWIVREPDAAESRRLCLHAGGWIQDYPGESPDYGGPRRKVVSVVA